jgi:hypothetical protein
MSAKAYTYRVWERRLTRRPAEGADRTIHGRKHYVDVMLGDSLVDSLVSCDLTHVGESGLIYTFSRLFLNRLDKPRLIRRIYTSFSFDLNSVIA